MSRETMLQLEGLKKYFPVGGGFLKKPDGLVKAVDGVDLSIKQGETLGLVGESGCGKTTVGRCIARLDDSTAGRILFQGGDTSRLDKERLKELRQEMQVIFQDPFSSLNPRKTAAHIIGEGFIIHGLYTPAQRREKVAELMALVGLRPEQGPRYPHEFSGGQRQRIGVARAIALRPKLVIADEPVSALDVSIQAQILNLFMELQEKLALTYLFISHDLSVVRHISDRVAVMYLGRIVESALTEELFKQPAHPYTLALIEAVPKADPARCREWVALEGDVPSPLNPPPGCAFHPRCPHSQLICSQERPRMRELASGHEAACHFPRGEWPA